MSVNVYNKTTGELTNIGGGGAEYDLEISQNKDSVVLTEDGTAKTTLPLICEFIGTRAQWEALSNTDKAKYRKINITDESTYGDISNDNIDFESSDTTDANATSWTSVSTLVSGLSLKTLFSRVSQMFKNTRYLYSRINKAWDVLRNTSSDAYSSSKAYAVGEHCIYNNVLYKCITACSAAAWSVNQNCFEETTLTSAVTDLNNDLTYVSGTLPVFSDLSWNDICTLPSGFTWNNCTIVGYCITDSNSAYVFTHRTDLTVRIEKSTNKIQTAYTQAVGYGSQSITFLIRKYK